MKISDDMIKGIKPLADKILFKWVKPKSKISGIILPDEVFKPGMRIGRWLNIEIIACGPDCRYVKPGDFSILNEYSRLTDVDAWSEDEVYFCEEKELKVIVTQEYIDNQDIGAQAGLKKEDPAYIKQLESEATMEVKSEYNPADSNKHINPNQQRAKRN